MSFVLRSLSLNYVFLFVGLFIAGCAGNSQLIPPATMDGFISQLSLANSYDFEFRKKSQDDTGGTQDC
ncbi:MAG: hypothetical protein ACI9JM_001719 [Halioglobus sp.]